MSSDARVIQVIETRLLRRGKGIESDPVRIVTQYWDFDGTLLAEVDPEQDRRDMLKMEGRYA